MNKQELIERVADSTGYSKAIVENVITSTLTNVEVQVKRGDYVKLVGFGTFTKVKRKARIGRNPQTGEEIKILSSFAPKFRAGKEFRAVVKN